MALNEEQLKWWNGSLSDKEKQELGALEYVLTRNYTDNFVEDQKRYVELSNKLWKYRQAHPYPRTPMKNQE